MAAFTVQNLTFTYPLGQAPALKNIDLSVNYGEMIAVCGKSGCGKSTLLRSLKTAIAPYGEREGEIFFYGRPLETVPQREQASRIGYVLQNPDNQIVTDKVWHELAFGLESLGYDTKTIRLRVAEMASFFGIQEWFMKDVQTLSGGQKQILNLASVMVMQPDVLILDEPTSQLDPIAAGDFLETVKKINREIGTTVIISEHRLEDVLPMADKAIIMDEGRIIVNEKPEDAAAILAKENHPMFCAMPSPLQAYSLVFREGIGRDLVCPLDVREGRNWLTSLFCGKSLSVTALPEKEERDLKGCEPVVQMKDVWFKYEKQDKDVVKDLSMSVYEGEIFAIVGGNGTGKTTTLSLISGIQKAYRGKIRIWGKEIQSYKSKELFSGMLGVLPQNPQTLFVKNTVRLDLTEVMDKKDGGKAEKENRLEEVARLVEIEHLLDRHPYDLSGGEQQRAALAKILLLNPKIILLDEPTKGIDNFFKEKLAGIFKNLTRQGVTILMVSHDVEFCGKYADRCAMFFDGNIVTINTPNKFFSGNSFYTTAANRMSRHIFKNAITAADVADLCVQNLKDPKPLPPGDDPPLEPMVKSVQGPTGKSKSWTKNLATAIMLTLVPVTLFAGIYLLNDRKYYFVSLMIIAYSMLPFFFLFEKRKPKARELIVISVLIAIGIAGRVAFFMVPAFKPVIAIVIISAMSLGPQAGFLVGTMTGFLSNFILGQGPWTPWQMFSFGVIGFIAGGLAKKGWLPGKRVPLVVFGAFMAFFVYGGVVDLWTIFGFYPEPDVKIALTIYTLAIPFNIIHAAATGIFLWVLAMPMIEKLERIKVKYGILR